MSDKADHSTDHSTEKDKFREILERKRNHQAERAAEAHGESKVHGEHAAAATRRAFRRKSG